MEEAAFHANPPVSTGRLDNNESIIPVDEHNRNNTEDQGCSSNPDYSTLVENQKFEMD